MVAEGNSTPPASPPAEPVDLAPVVRQLVRRRQQLGMKQVDVAKAMRTGQPTVCHLEKARNPRLATLVRYAEAVGARISVEVIVPEDPSGGDDE